jgi:hypothetical protein
VNPCPCVSGYFPWLPPTTAPLGPGAATPERKLVSGRAGDSKLPHLPCALERHGLDPRIVAQEDDR